MTDTMDGDSDDALIDRFRGTGEMRHLDALVHRHIGKVRSMIHAMVLNDADADDLTQEVFLRAIRGIEGFRRKSAFGTWLFRITMNATYGFLKRKGRNPVEHQAEVPERQDRGSHPAAGLMSHETDAEVRRALAALSPPLRAAITLTAIQGMNVTEAARAERCLPATMYWRVHQARKRLKARLGRPA